MRTPGIFSLSRETEVWIFNKKKAKVGYFWRVVLFNLAFRSDPVQVVLPIVVAVVVVAVFSPLSGRCCKC